jgi:hypothetical protein
MEKTFVTAAGLAAALMLTGVPASADPDPHIPNPAAGYCAGAKVSERNSATGLGYCDGSPYPDGSYWHIVQTGVAGPPAMQCVVKNDSGATPLRAPPGGCNGAVQ